MRYHHIECRFSYGVLEVLCEGFKITPRARMLEFSIGTYGVPVLTDMFTIARVPS